MRIEELQDTLCNVVASGQIGTPVALRLHVHVSKSDLAAIPAEPACFDIAELVFGQTSGKDVTRENSDGRHRSTLRTYPSGQTLLITTTAGLSRTSRMDLLLIGNHGIVRLEGADLNC
jgi:hypothetical protein